MQFPIIVAVLTLGGSVIAFLYREYTGRNKIQDERLERTDKAIHSVEDRTLVLETKWNTSGSTIESLRARQELDAVRLATTQAAVEKIREDVNFIKHEISVKLERIPEVIEALNNFRELVKASVPRFEVEARFDANELRMSELSSEIRGNKDRKP